MKLCEPRQLPVSVSENVIIPGQTGSRKIEKYSFTVLVCEISH